MSNLTRRGATANAPAKLPALQTSRIVDPNIRQAVDALREWVEVRLGARGDYYERAVTFRDLDPQIEDIAGQIKIIEDSLAALVAAEGSATTETDLLALRSQDAAIQLEIDLIRRRISSVESTLGTLVAPTGSTSGGGGGAVTLTGDVTGTGTGTVATTIAADAVTYAKLQNISATARILGRKTAAAGNTEECTLSEVLDFVGSAAQGDILYRNASAWTRLAAGTAGQELRTAGAGADPAWSSQPLVAAFFYPGVPTASVLVGIFAAPAGVTTATYAAAIAGSSGVALVAATAQTDFDVRKNATTAANGTSVGTVRFAAAGTVPTFIAASGFSLTGGTDTLTVWAPATPDATLANIAISLYAVRS